MKITAKITGRIIMGEEVKKLPKDVLDKFAFQISKGLRLYPHTMIQQTKQNILTVIYQNRAVFYVDDSTESFTLKALAILWDARQNFDPQFVNDIEFGSWLSFEEGKGYGEMVLESARKLAATLSPNSRLLAVVESSNILSKRIIENVGNALINVAFSKYLKTPKGLPAEVNIYVLN